MSQDSASQEAFDTYASVLGSSGEMADKFIAHSLMKSYKMQTLQSIQALAKAQDIVVRAPAGLEKTDFQEFVEGQQIMDTIESVRHFAQIIDLLKINYLETTQPLHEGKNVHELVTDLEAELAGSAITRSSPSFLPFSTKLKLGTLFETKHMNPPYYFSWEFTIGTYMPFLAPFIISLLQIGVKLAVGRIRPDVAKVKTE